MKILVSLLMVMQSVCLFAQSKNQILDQHAKSVRADFWQQVTTMEASGYWRLGQETEQAGQYQLKGNDRLRFDNTSQTVVYNAGTAWQTVHATKRTNKTTQVSQLQALRWMAVMGSPLVTIPRDKLTYKGEVGVDEFTCYWFRQTDAQVDYFIRKADYLLYRIIDESSGQQISLTYKTYRKFAGISIATVIQARSADLYLEIVMDNIVLGAGIPDSRFEFGG